MVAAGNGMSSDDEEEEMDAEEDFHYEMDEEQRYLLLQPLSRPKRITGFQE